jgi:DNA-binding NarL/FixJ family response regulator
MRANQAKTGPGSGGEDGTAVTTVAVQQGLRFFREGLALLLDAEPDIRVVGTAVTLTDLEKLCADTPPAVAVLELHDPPVESCRSAAAMQADLPELRFVGLGLPDAATNQPCPSIEGFSAVIDRRAGIRPVIEAVRAARLTPTSAISVPAAPEGIDVLSHRETDVLALVGAGCTTRDISDRLAISRKTVENHKQRIFTKLQVQNQAHAVAVAMRAGMISPDGVLDLTDDALA